MNQLPGSTASNDTKQHKWKSQMEEGLRALTYESIVRKTQFLIIFNSVNGRVT